MSLYRDSTIAFTKYFLQIRVLCYNSPVVLSVHFHIFCICSQDLLRPVSVAALLFLLQVLATLECVALYLEVRASETKNTMASV